MADKAAPKNTIVINSKVHVRGYVKPHSVTVEGHTVTTNEVLYLKPGANVIDEAQLAAFAKGMQEDFENGIIYKMDKPLSGYQAAEAISIVQLTAELAILRGFRAIEKREAVVAAIDRQVSEITDPRAVADRE